MEITAKKDIYDEEGRLLLSKGQIITDEIIAKLKRFGLSEPEEIIDVIDVNEEQHPVLDPIAQAFQERKGIRNQHVLERPHQVLSTIIFESKSEPWWIHVNALSNHVEWLYTHSIDVAMISLIMAVELGYNEKELFNLGLGALLHDVGKLLIPKPILLKPGPLSDSEMLLVRQHCELGVSSLEGFDLPKQYTDVVLKHHERLDGSGYPTGLKADEIPLNVKIVMIADVADAITSYRPHRPAQDMDAALNLLKSEREKYDQELVALLKRVLEYR